MGATATAPKASRADELRPPRSGPGWRGTNAAQSSAHAAARSGSSAEITVHASCAEARQALNWPGV
ncbi:hypothetical protein V9K83_01715 [Streptomyces griseoaurantiacus]|nr:hypothetical protein [Streptomyces griseoaurantiacus]